MSRHLAFAVAGLVVLAGCNAVPFADLSGPAQDETVTPAPVEDVELTPTAPEPASTPPGVHPNGSVNERALSQAHSEFLADRSYTWVAEVDVRDGGYVDGPRLGLRVAVDGEQFLAEESWPGSGLNRAMYADHGEGYLRIEETEETRFDAVTEPGVPLSYVFTNTAILQFLGGISYNVTLVEHEGQVFYRIFSAGEEAPSLLRDSGTTVSNYAATAYVTTRGFVRTLAVGYERGRDGQRRQVFVRFDYTDVGATTVGEPEWVSQVTRTVGGIADSTATGSDRAITAAAPSGTANGTDRFQVRAADSTDDIAPYSRPTSQLANDAGPAPGVGLPADIASATSLVLPDRSRRPIGNAIDAAGDEPLRDLAVTGFGDGPQVRDSR